MLTVQVAGWVAFILGAAGFVSVLVEEAWRYHRRGIRMSRIAASEEGPSLGDTGPRSGAARLGAAKGAERSPRLGPAAPLSPAGKW